MSLKKSNICIFFHSIWKNLHLTENFYTGTACGACDKYEVWIVPSCPFSKKIIISSYCKDNVDAPSPLIAWLLFLREFDRFLIETRAMDTWWQVSAVRQTFYFDFFISNTFQCSCLTQKFSDGKLSTSHKSRRRRIAKSHRLFRKSVHKWAGLPFGCIFS